VSAPRLSILIADDHAVLRTGLRMLLEAQPDMVVVGEAGDGSEVSRKAGALRPDIVLMDLSMPGPPSGEVIRQVLQAWPATRVLVLTMHDDAAYATAALAAGATGYVVKKVADTELLSAIRAVRSGRSVVDVTIASVPSARATPGSGGATPQAPKGLSRRELEVLRLLAEGNSNQQVADRIGVSVKTVETYRTRLRDKLGLKGRADLFRFAVESGILDAGPDGPSGGGR
jgi:two-component system response regulator NreC